MAALGTFFLGWPFAPLLPAGEIASYIAGLNRGGSFESIPDRSSPPRRAAPSAVKGLDQSGADKHDGS